MATENADNVVQEAWGWMLFAYARVLNALQADLTEQHDIPLTWFDVMNRLREKPDQKMRMRELEEASLFTKSGLTRLVDRIEEAGFVRRERSAEDRRGVYVVMTDAGNEKMNRVWPDHVASIHRHFGQYLELEDAQALTVASQKILSKTEQDRMERWLESEPVPAAVPHVPVPDESDPG